MGDDDVYCDLFIDKEGELEVVAPKEKRSKFWVLIAGTSLLYKNKEEDDEAQEVIDLKSAKVEKTKESFSLVTKDGSTYQFFTDAPKEWIKEIEANVKQDKKSKKKKGKKQTLKLKMQKKAGSIAMSTSKGKKVVRDAIGSDGVKVMDMIKAVVESKDGKDKAKDIEDGTIRILVKIVLLFKNGRVTREELLSPIPLIKPIWSNVLDYCEMSFAYEPDKLGADIANLQKEIDKLIRPYLTEKNMDKMNEMIDYLRKKETLDQLFACDENDKLKAELQVVLRKIWDKVFNKKKGKK
mmetsp:Transcript_6977/g.7664  ORF Transcript_6977/g.7664 Transcript_6977/m.7664 type:complete len:295 (-) Transcript_6977:174-1058(-)